MKKVLITLALLLAFVSSGYGQGTGPITVKEADGSPSYTGIRTFIFDNGTVTVSGNTARITNGGGGGSGTVTSVSVVSANGLAGSVATATTTPAITLSTTITGILKGNGTAISAATPGTDYSNGVANPTASVGLTVVNGSATTAMRSDGAPALDQSIAPTWTGAHTHTNTIALTSTTAANNKITQGAAINIGTTSTDGIVLQNTTAAAVGAQQYSPRLRLTGSGWKTTATAAAQTVDYIVELQPVQGTTNPSANLVFTSQINGAGYSANPILMTSNGIFGRDGNGSATTFAVGSINSSALRTGIDVQSDDVYVTHNTNRLARFSNGGGLRLRNDMYIGFTLDSTLGVPDTLFTRGGVATFRLGNTDVASPVAQTLSVQNVVTGTSNTAGVDWTFKGSAGTGTGATGKTIFQLAGAGSTGSTPNTFATVLQLDAAASNATGLSITGGATGTVVTLTALDSGSNAGITLTPKGSGAVTAVTELRTANSFAISASVGNLVFWNGAAIGWNSTASAPTGASSLDTMITRAAAANLRHGAADAASPVAQTISVQNVVAGTSNTAGANFTIAGSRGTGTGAGGSLIFQVAPAGSTGTSQNALSTVMTIASDLSVTLPGALTVASCTGCGSGTTYATSGNYYAFPQENFGNAANTSALVGSANQVRAVKVFLNRAITIDRLGLKGSGGSAGLASFGIYNADGSTRTVYSGTIDTNTGWTAAQAVTVSSSGTVGPGYIMVMWTADNTSATIYTHGYNSNWLQLQTVGTAAIVGTCANAASTGALPSTCGTFTADSSITNFPMLNWYKN